MLRLIREARAAAGMTQVEVCALLGRPTSWLSKCELGERRLDPIDLLDLASVYGISIKALLPRPQP